MEERSRFRGSFVRRGSAHTTSQPQAVSEPVHHHSGSHQPATPQAKKPKKVGFFFGRKWLIAVIAALVLLAVGLGYMYVHTKNQLNAAKNPTAAGNTETEKIVAVVSKSVQLPSGETPTLASVNDVSKLKGQAFFKNAQNGDKVLVYTKAGQAVLYRPSTQKVILFSFVNSTANQ